MPRIMRSMAAISRCGNQYRTKELSALGLKGNQSIYLLQICRHPGLTQDQLARNLTMDKSAVARQLTCLEELGYVRRETTANDKRVLLVYPTQKAQDALPEIHRVLRAWEDLITADLSPESREALIGALETMHSRALRWAEED